MAASATPKNAITRRVDQLGELWNEFAQKPDARLARWLVDGDSARMVDLFLDVQNDDAGDIPDLFVRFSEPFDGPGRFGFTLRESLCQKYEEVRDGLSAEGVRADWSCPSVKPGESDIAAFVCACASFRQHYEGTLVLLVVVLLPHETGAPADWEQWLHSLVRAGLPTGVRVMVIDDATAPVLGGMTTVEPKRVVTIKPQLDMPGAYMELVRGIPGSGPGFTFRRLFIALTNAAGKGDMAAAKQAAERASKLAAEQNWPHLQVATAMALAAAHLGAGNKAEALATYQSAGKVVGDSKDPTSAKLRLQTQFAEAAVLVGDGKYTEAAPIYQETATLAAKQNDSFATLEGWRMAAYCREMAKQYAEAWTCGQKALEVGTKLDKDTRLNSTLPYVGECLLRVAQQPSYTDKADAVRQRMVQLLGPNWQEKRS